MPESTLMTVSALKTFFTVLLTAVVGVIGKIAYDYFKDGRMEKESIYVSHAACQRNQTHCSANSLKDTVTDLHTDFETFKAETKAHQKDTEKRLNENNFEIRTLRKDIMEIKAAQSRTNALLELLVENIKK